ncbi:MAG: hypothetical protein MRZ79_13870 [Bacteroidia bacterium]|nr:hypothetical protein [Bacteroidia bacterium]
MKILLTGSSGLSGKVVNHLLLLFLCIQFLGCQRHNSVGFMRENVIKQKNDFAELADYYRKLTASTEYPINYSIGDKGISIHILNSNGNIAAHENRFSIINQKPHSPAMDSVLRLVGWSYQDLNYLNKKLNVINCSGIWNPEFFASPIVLLPTGKQGFVNSTYHIYPEEEVERLKILKNKPLGSTKFLKRVYIMTSSSL